MHQQHATAIDIEIICGRDKEHRILPRDAVLTYQTGRLRADGIGQRRIRLSVQHEQGIHARVLGKAGLDERDAERAQLLERRRIIGVGASRLIRVRERCLQITDTQLSNVHRRVPVEGYVLHAQIAIVGSLDGIQHHGAVFHASAHRPDLVEAPAECHHAVPADAAERGPQARDTTNARRLDDRSQRLRTQRKCDQTRRHSARGACRRAL